MEGERSTFHRNHYGEYICRTCLATGKRWSRRRRILKYVKEKILPWCVRGLGYLLLLAVVIGLLFAGGFLP